VCACARALELPLLAVDERILPSADSQPDVAFDDDCSQHVDTLSQTQQSCNDTLDKLSLNYARGVGCRRSRFVPPSDAAARPLQRCSYDESTVDDVEGIAQQYIDT